MVEHDPPAPTTLQDEYRDRRAVRCVRVLDTRTSIPGLAVADPGALARGRRDRAGHPPESARPRLRCASSTRRIPSVRRRRGRAVVHGAVRPRLAAHLAAWRCRSTRRSPSARCGRSPTLPGHARSTPAPRSSPVASSTRCGSAATRRSRSAAAAVYYGTADATPCSSCCSASCAAGAGLPRTSTRCSPHADRALEWIDALRRPRRRRLRRVRAAQRSRPRQPGLEGLVGRHQLRRRVARPAPDRAVRGAGLRVRGVPRACDGSPRAAATTRLAADWGARGRGAEARVQRAVLAARPGLVRARPRRATSDRSTPAPRTWATACGPGSSTTTRPRRSPSA